MKLSSIKLSITMTIALMSATSSGSTYDITADSIERHISVLASDSLEGREVGEAGEWKAAQYISGIFKAAGLNPLGGNGTYLQSFVFTKRIDFGPKNRLVLNGSELELYEEYKPMRQSASQEFSFEEIVFVDFGIVMDSTDGDYNDYSGKDVSGKAVVINRHMPDSTVNPHIDFSRYNSLTSKIIEALDRNAKGIFFITPESHDDTLPGMGPVRVTPKEIPIIFLRRAALERLGISLSNPQIMSAVGETQLIKTKDTGYNVIGQVSTDNDTTVVIGAHYDHLGWGGAGSLYAGKEKMIHNGADDNASGVSAVLELARYFQARSAEARYSMLFIGFSGEEAGLLGSNYFAKHMTVDSNKVRMMINFDMIGRQKEQESGVAVLGTGTAEEFKEYFADVHTDALNIVHKEPGTGPSDHTSFYNLEIPVLHFFTGAHKDYHKPSDDVEFIDFEGTAGVTRFAAEVLEHFDQLGKELVFQKTKDPDADKRRSAFSVTLGIMPDYITEVKGLRIDGVTTDRPGERAGLLTGDIIIEMGGMPVGDIYDYMNCLGRFRKHDTTNVLVQREGDTLSVRVIFE